MTFKFTYKYSEDLQEAPATCGDNMNCTMSLSSYIADVNWNIILQTHQKASPTPALSDV